MPALRLNRASGHSGRQRFGSLIQHREILAVSEDSAPLFSGQLVNDAKLDEKLERLSLSSLEAA
jgi:hypothetical protein